LEIYLYGGYYRKAAADLNQLLILDPHHATGYLNRGLVYATMTQRAMVYSNAESIRNLKSIGVVEVEEE
jgi:regulator of sirC expression with transglutaminase-like and TPR domain